MFNPATFYWSAFFKPGKSAVMYMCFRGIHFASVSLIYLLDFGIASTEWYFLLFSFIIMKLSSKIRKSLYILYLNIILSYLKKKCDYFYIYLRDWKSDWYQPTELCKQVIIPHKDITVAWTYLILMF